MTVFNCSEQFHRKTVLQQSSRHDHLEAMLYEQNFRAVTAAWGDCHMISPSYCKGEKPTGIADHVASGANAATC